MSDWSARCPTRWHWLRWPVLNVPVYIGADRPLLGAFVNETRVHGIDGLGGIALPPGGAAVSGVAADAIRAILRSAQQRVTLVGIAPVNQPGSRTDDGTAARRSCRADRADDGRLG